MKIQRIRFQNLNSLAGIWEIDFKSPAYAGNNLFAITGPTGAGKSTLLDAICLALYGTTPRLGKITKSSNQIMSRHTGVCFAEVEFSTTKGNFRCHWSQHRSRQKAQEKLQVPRHEITDSVKNKLLESSIRNVAKKVEEVTGMDFDRFTRSTLLAQGRFAAFLQASADERAPLLEQITGTEIYSRLSIKVHEMKSEEQNKLKECNQILSTINLLQPEEEEELKKRIIETEKENKKIRNQLNTYQSYLTWVQTIVKLEKEYKGYGKQLDTLKKEQEEHQEYLSSLQPALAAKEIFPLHSTVQKLEEAQRNALHELANLEKDSFSLNESKQSIEVTTGQALKTLQQSMELQRGVVVVIRRVEKLDHKLRDSTNVLQEQTTTLNSIRDRLKIELSTLQTTKKQLLQLQSDKNDLDTFFKSHIGDEKLTTEFATLEFIIHRLDAIYPEFEHFQQTQKQKILELQNKKDSLQTLKKDRTSAQDELALAIKRCLKINENIKLLSHGNDFSDLQQNLFITKNREKSVHELTLLFQQKTVAIKRIITLQEQIKIIITNAEERTKIHSLITKEHTVKQNQITLLEDNLLLLARIQTLEEDRKHLAEGAPCPLCGSLNHPYNHGNSPTTSKEKQQLEKAKGELKEIIDQTTALNREDIASKEKKKFLSKQIDETQQQSNTVKTTIEQLLSTLELPCLSKIGSDELQQELQKAVDHKNILESELTHHQNLTKELDTLNTQIQKRTTHTQNLEKEVITVQHNLASAEKDQENITRQELKLSDELKLLENDLSEKLRPHGTFKIAKNTLSDILLTLNQRINLWKAKKDEEKRLIPKLIKLDAELTHKQTFCAKESKLLTGQEVHCNLLKTNFEELQQKREALFGQKETEAEEKQLELSVAEARETHAQSLVKAGDVERKITAAHTLQDHLTIETQARSQEIATQKDAFTKAITQSNFATSDEFLKAIRTPQQLIQLQELQSKLQEKETEFTTLRKDKYAQLRLEKEKHLCSETEAEIKKQLLEQETQVEALQKETITAKEQFRRNTQDKGKVSIQLAAIEAQKKKCSAWNKLHLLIGSSDGKKFRNFAQGLTFEMMIHHANSHLKKMDNRYILLRDKTQPLDINVIDTYQADEIRSTKNLSGGESFLVSLALALGLSRMASHNIRVDSLFLDEGFGTLDENALESALETLAQLREENKLIGIISHVGALKERVPLQIKIIPGSRGNSTITGPGVTREG